MKVFKFQELGPLQILWSSFLQVNIHWKGMILKAGVNVKKLWWSNYFQACTYEVWRLVWWFASKRIVEQTVSTFGNCYVQSTFSIAASEIIWCGLVCSLQGYVIADRVVVQIFHYPRWAVADLCNCLCACLSVLLSIHPSWKLISFSDISIAVHVTFVHSLCTSPTDALCFIITSCKLLKNFPLFVTLCLHAHIQSTFIWCIKFISLWRHWSSLLTFKAIRFIDRM